MDFKHIPVLLKPAIIGLNIKPNGIYVDGTIGGAGHSKKIIEKLNSNGMLIGIDRDLDALRASEENLKGYNNFKLIHGNHDEIRKILEDINIEKVDGILLDLGVSSYQLDEKDRGFSYIGNNTLDMRMDRTQELSAFDVVNKYSENDLANIIYEYGEEKFSKRIARKIVEKRKMKNIETTGELSKIIEEVIPFSKDGNPSKRTFQALRIEVNNELKPLKNTIKDCIKLLKNNGRLCIITFHSLEDRGVKQAFKEATGICSCQKDISVCVCGAEKLGDIITKKPILPTPEEIKENPRSKSAKLRIFERKEVK